MADIIKFHLSLNVSDLTQAVVFYRAFFGTDVAKFHRDYAKFEIDEPPVIFSLTPQIPDSGNNLKSLAIMRNADGFDTADPFGTRWTVEHRKEKHRFQIHLNCADLERSLQFYRALLGQSESNSTRFQLDEPSLDLVLHEAETRAGGALNHVGIRYPDSESLVAIQRRLEMAGISTRREDGVECCYARQTKFWVTDPDGLMWELYTLHEDIPHSGSSQLASLPVVEPALAWGHRLGEELPTRIPHEDATLNEVSLEGTFNTRIAPERFQSFLIEILRVLMPNGSLKLHGLVIDKPLTEEPRLPGIASVVKYIPTPGELKNLLSTYPELEITDERTKLVECFSTAELHYGDYHLHARKKPIS